jgi:hypothetical protein
MCRLGTIWHLVYVRFLSWSCSSLVQITGYIFFELAYALKIEGPDADDATDESGMAHVMLHFPVAVYNKVSLFSRPEGSAALCIPRREPWTPQTMARPCQKAEQRAVSQRP